MSVDSNFPISIQQLHSLSPKSLVGIAREWIERTSPTCLVHPHGFWVVLLSKSQTEEWRFHYWPKGPRFTTGMPARIHTHDRVVESRIVLGQIKHIVHRLVNTKSGGRPVYKVLYVGDKYSQETSNVLAKTVDRAEVGLKIEQTMNVGSSYRVEAHTYHEAVVGNEFATATVVCMHSHAPGNAKVLGLDSYPDEVSFRRLGRSVEEVLCVIRAI